MNAIGYVDLRAEVAHSEGGINLICQERLRRLKRAVKMICPWSKLVPGTGTENAQVGVSFVVNSLVA